MTNKAPRPGKAPKPKTADQLLKRYLELTKKDIFAAKDFLVAEASKLSVEEGRKFMAAFRPHTSNFNAWTVQLLENLEDQLEPDGGGPLFRRYMKLHRKIDFTQKKALVPEILALPSREGSKFMNMLGFYVGRNWGGVTEWDKEFHSKLEKKFGSDE